MTNEGVVFKLKPINFLGDWAEIIKDLSIRCGKSIIDKDCYVFDFDQIWASTALGFGGVGGSAMTKARTYVIIYDDSAYVYFNGHYAYTVNEPWNEEFNNDIADECMAGCAVASTRYKE